MGTRQQELIKLIEKYDTPTITNVVATYPASELCLGLYNPWECAWYTDSDLKCVYPELGPRAGYAVTCVMGLYDPGYNNCSRLDFSDVLRAVDASPKPAVVVIKQQFPPHLKNRVGLSGMLMTTGMKKAGAVACLSDGPSRDIDDIRQLDFQYMLTGLSAGHGVFKVQAVNVPVSICGMDVAPGEIIHMDVNGAVKFPADKLEQVAGLAEKLIEKETADLARMNAATTFDELMAAMNAKPKK